MTLIVLLYGPGPGRTSSASSSHRESEHVDKAYFNIPSSCPRPRLPTRPPPAKATQTPKAQSPSPSKLSSLSASAPCTLHPCVLFASQASGTHWPCSSRCKYPAQTGLLLSSLWSHDARDAMGVACSACVGDFMPC